MRQHGKMLYCEDGMNEKFSWAKDVISRMLGELAEEIESVEDLKIGYNQNLKLMT